MALGLKRIILRAVTLQGNHACLDLRRGRIFIRRHNLSLYGDGRADMQLRNACEICDGFVIDHLRILETGSVIKINETDILLLAVIADPALHADFLTEQLGKMLLKIASGNDLHWSFLQFHGC